MIRIAVLITDLFEDSEYKVPFDAFKKAGYELIHVGIEAGKTVKGKGGKETAIIDVSVNDAKAEHFDALFIPGGYSPDKLRADDKAVEFVRDFAKTNRPILTICHGPQILITAKVLKGRTMTGYKSIRVDMENAGVNFIDRELVIDGNLVSSRIPADLPAFVEGALTVLKNLK